MAHSSHPIQTAPSEPLSASCFCPPLSSGLASSATSGLFFPSVISSLYSLQLFHSIHVSLLQLTRKRAKIRTSFQKLKEALGCQSLALLRRYKCSQWSSARPPTEGDPPPPGTSHVRFFYPKVSLIDDTKGNRMKGATH